MRRLVRNLTRVVQVSTCVVVVIYCGILFTKRTSPHTKNSGESESLLEAQISSDSPAVAKFLADANYSVETEPEPKPVELKKLTFVSVSFIPTQSSLLKGTAQAQQITDFGSTKAGPSNNLLEHTDDTPALNSVTEVLPNDRETLVAPRRSEKYKSPWTWRCAEDRKCHRARKRGEEPFVSLDTCWLGCGREENLWPKPNPWSDEAIFVGTDTIKFTLNNFVLKTIVESREVNDLLQDAFTVLVHNMKLLLPPLDDIEKDVVPSSVSVVVTVRSPTVELTLVTDESYTLNVDEIPDTETDLKISVTAETFFGARHAFETLSQLVALDPTSGSLQIVSKVSLSDLPAFPYRGLMIDVARNFVPIPALKRMVDGMAANKLNILHWHLTDSNSFPIYCPSFPQMTDYGAYSANEIYHPAEVKEFVQYARVRGVMVIPEVDAPAHAGNGWQWGDEENGFGELALCVNEEPFNGICGQPPCGQLNPANPNVYKVLGGIYSDILDTFQANMFHMGGDEVTYRCWATPEIENYSKIHNITSYIKLRAFETLKIEAEKISKKTPVPILWTSDLTTAIRRRRNYGIPPDEYIIQTWQENRNRASDIRLLLAANYPVIISDLDDFYLDLGGGSWLGRNHDWKYINWQELYKFNFKAHGYNISRRVYNTVLGDIPQILGGEAPLWTEKVNADTMDGKLWPRGAAFAERLWLNPDHNETDSSLVYARLLRQNERMRVRGIRASSQQPKSCVLINGNCENSQDPQP